jgi:hypothetical protein
LVGFPKKGIVYYLLFVENKITHNRKQLFVGGSFQSESEIDVVPPNLAVWDCSSESWADYPGVQLISYSDVPAIYTIALGRDRIFIGGCFDEVNGNTVNNIAVYIPHKNGWTNVDVGVTSQTGTARLYSLDFDFIEGRTLNLFVS